MNHTLLLIGREATGREASPSAGVIDSQSVKTTESGGLRGYDAGKKIKGRKRHILTDTDGNLLHAVIRTADIQERDGAPLVLAEIIKRFPWLRHVFVDGGYAGDKLIRRAKLKSMIHFRKPKGKPMDWRRQRANAARSKVRSAVEHVFATRKSRMALFVRTIGIERARMKIGMANLAYNFRRLVWHEGRTAPA